MPEPYMASMPADVDRVLSERFECLFEELALTVPVEGERREERLLVPARCGSWQVRLAPGNVDPVAAHGRDHVFVDRQERLGGDHEDVLRRLRQAEREESATRESGNGLCLPKHANLLWEREVLGENDVETGASEQLLHLVRIVALTLLRTTGQEDAIRVGAFRPNRG